ncbi:LysR family transcriptional regulator [Nocardia sp. NPDC051570]|uniref:LysR family transcriptional regulator n=1 Tax=Nocardia sp. NPDC051570 TaxID=3364324 RepID=UPI00378D015E
MELEVRHLRMLCAIAEHGSLTKAAAALGMLQPALTRQLQRLEQGLGGPLFTRSGNGSVPTPLGEHVLSRARAVLPALDGLNSDALREAAGCEHPSRIRYGAVLGPLAAGLLPPLRRLLPAADVRLLSEPSNTVLADLVAGGRLELAAILEFPGYELWVKPDVQRHVIATEPVFVLLPCDHPAAQWSEVPLAALAQGDWALEPPDDNRFREYVTVACRAAGFTPRVCYEAEAGSLTDLISSGQAIGLGQATFRVTPRIAVRPLAGNPLWESHALIWQKYGPFAGLVPKLIGAAEQVYEAAVGRSPAFLEWRDRQG